MVNIQVDVVQQPGTEVTNTDSGRNVRHSGLLLTLLQVPCHQAHDLVGIKISNAGSIH